MTNAFDEEADTIDGRVAVETKMKPFQTVDYVPREDEAEGREGAPPGPSPFLTPHFSTNASAIPQLFGEIRELYRRRLREIGVIAGGTWWLLFAYFASGVNPVMSPGVLGWGFAAILATPVVAFPIGFVWLSVRTNASTPRLRAVEWVFLVTTLLPLLAWRSASVSASMAAPLEGPGGMAARFSTAYCNFPCTAMIIVYGVFVPNTRRRAATILSLLAIAVVATDVATWWPHLPSATPVFLDSGFQTGVMLFLSLGTALYGSFKVGALQREAMAARAQVRQLGQYHLTRLLGAGAMGEVHLAEHRLLKRPCAVKLVRPERAADPKALARFEREVQSTARLRHPNVIEIYDYGRTEDGTFYYVMEYLDGLTLDDLVRLHGRMPPCRALFVFGQLCAALRAAHHIGLVHRDIKPGNVFLSRNGELRDVVKLLDFGLVHAIAESEPRGRLTQDGGIVGTPDYMSPEQAEGSGTVDGRTDIYALGGVLYCMLTGQPPLGRGTIVQSLIAHRQETARSLRDRECDASNELEELVRRCLAKSPNDRFADVGQLASAAAACPENQGWDQARARDWWEAFRARPEPSAEALDTADRSKTVLLAVEKEQGDR